MQRAFTSLFFTTLPLATLGCLITSTAKAQIIPDNSLGNESSVVNPQDAQGFPVDQIDGGATRGANLFHSFQDFNIDAVRGAYFSNPDGINNIFSRVTGRNPSNINGVLGVLGDANLFLINPNSIIFGQNARLDLGGSFFASTADSLLFEGDTEFSAVNPQAPPLLEVAIPIGARFRDNPGEIVNRSFAPNIAGDFVGLEVLPGENLTLLGGDINLETSRVTAKGGNVKLGGLSAAGVVNINNDGSLNFSEDVVQADINLSNIAIIDVSSIGGGSISINARNLNLEAGDFDLRSVGLIAGITGDSTSSDAQAGDITINATDSVNINNSFIFNRVNPGAIGNGGDITISTANLTLANSGQIDASTFGVGNAGKIVIEARDLISLKGIGVGSIDDPTRIDTQTAILNRVEEESTGNTGGITINSKTLSLTDSAKIFANLVGKGNNGDVSIDVNNLTLQNGSQISTSAFPSSQGEAGDLIVNALESIELIGTASTVEFDNIPSSLLSQNASNANPGNISIETKKLSIQDGAGISVINFAEGKGGNLTINASDSIQLIGTSANSRLSSGLFSLTSNQLTENLSVSFNNGDAGNLDIDTKKLIIRDGARIDSSNIGKGNAGEITIRASDIVRLSGTSSNGMLTSSLFSQTQGGGSAGDINIFTEQLDLNNKAQISVSGLDDLGDAGNINIFASSIRLDNFANLSSDTRAGEGNLFLQADDILLRRNSNISTDAKGSSTGGNITIDTENLIAFPSENSDISANAEESFGGRVIINAKGIFGTEFRETPTLQSDITATSELGAEFTGEVAINTPDFDPTSGLIELSQAVSDASDQISQNPCQQGVGSEFIVTGKGGLPPNVNEALNSESAQVDLVEAVPSRRQGDWETGRQGEKAQQTENHSTEAVPAMGWVFNDKGEVTLTAYSTSDTEIHRSRQQHHPTCSSRIAP